MEEDQQKQRQQADAAQVEGDGYRLVLAPVQEVRRRVEADHRQAQHQERTPEALDDAVDAVGGEVEEASGHEKERAEVEGDLREREHAAADDPVVLARVQGAIRLTDAVRLVRVDQLEAQPLLNLLEVRRDAGDERGGVRRRPRQHRPPVEVAPEVLAHLARRLIARGGVGLHRLEDDGLERLGHRRLDLDGQARPARADRGDERVVGEPVERPRTRQDLVADHAQRVDVGARVDRARRIELLGREVRQRPAQVAARRIAAGDPEVEDTGLERHVEHDVRRLEVAMLNAQAVRVVERLAHAQQDLRPLPELERGRHAPQLEALDELHDDDGRIGVGAELVDLDDAAIVEEGERAGLLQEVAEGGRQPAAAAEHLARHDPAEPLILELVDLAGAAGADALDGAEALERRGLPRRSDGAGVERRRPPQVAGDERAERLDEIVAPLAHLLERQLVARAQVMFDERGEAFLEVGCPRHVASVILIVSAAMARASSIRHASSLRPRRAAMSLKLSSSNLRSRMISRCASLSPSIARSSRAVSSSSTSRLVTERAAAAAASCASSSGTSRAGSRRWRWK